MDNPTTHKSSCTCGHSAKVEKSKEAVNILNQDSELPILLALLPCGLRNAFQQAVFNAFPELMDAEKPKVVIEGNLNYEKSLFTSIDQLTSIDELPDIFISSDINSLYHKRFLDEFLNATNFETFTFDVHPLFKKARYVHPEGLMSWLTSNLLVLVVDTKKMENRSLPISWLDILDESFEGDLTLRGDTDFFCNALFFPYMKSTGDKAIKKLGKNTAKGLHPSQMVKTLNSGNEAGTSIYAMPYSFALKVRDTNRFKIIFPAEGAIVSPVQMLVKKGAYLKHKPLIDYILSEEMANILIQNGFPTAHPSVKNKILSNTLDWIGWDFIQINDIKVLKEKMQHLFFSEFKGGLELLVDVHGKK